MDVERIGKKSLPSMFSIGSIIYIANPGPDALVPAGGQHYTDATAPHQGPPEDSYTSALQLSLESIYDGQMERQIAASEAHLYE